MVSMIKNKAVACIRVGDKFYDADSDGVVKIPFGEYGVHLRNRNKDKILVARVFIDGEAIHKEGSGFVFYENEADTIWRSMFADKAFKLVPEGSGEAVEFGKSGPDTLKQRGIVEVEFYEGSRKPKYVPPKPVVVEEHHHHHHYPRPRPWYWGDPYYGTLQARGVSMSSDNVGSVNCSTVNDSFTETKTSGGGGIRARFSKSDVSESTISGASAAMFGGVGGGELCSSAPDIEEACTVDGAATGQGFKTTYDVEVDWSTSTKMRFRLMGYVAEEEEVIVVATSKKKPHVNSEIEQSLATARQKEAELELQLANARIEALQKQIAELQGA